MILQDVAAHTSASSAIVSARALSAVSLKINFTQTSPFASVAQRPDKEFLRESEILTFVLLHQNKQGPLSAPARI